jgi:hypothetical protein
MNLAVIMDQCLALVLCGVSDGLVAGFNPLSDGFVGGA